MPDVAIARTRPPAARRRRLRRITLVVSTLLVTVLAAEAALLVFGLYPPMPDAWPGEFENRPHPHFEPDPLVGWRMKPGVEFTQHTEGIVVTYAADGSGHRTGPHPRDRAAARHRVILAGDSFFWGAEVSYDDSLAARLERRYDTVSITNLAQPGFGLDQIWQSVVHHGLPIEPALVIVGIYPQDCSRSHTAWRDDLGIGKPMYRSDGSRLVPVTPADRPCAPWSFLEHHSRVLGLWHRAERNVGFRWGIGPWWSLNEAILDELRQAVAARGSRLLLVHVPLHDWRPFGALSSWARRHAVPLVDPVQSDPQRPAGLYYEPDRHFAPRGVRYLADQIIDLIEREGPPLGR